ncbi:conserved hypothetical protein [Cellulomonas flavigena DSM 20109]|uniref:Peptidoglycan-binding domain 1 protein n=1 Tax=Cellulomonas flavigena (strain ATCC 482 / DSM 20109 / BCRC 11376 / JCM 18109 / NBRC 3775 / NCIMB 8073 / NRS 134) TaxID=446466 RepID=D5UI38_CELFN|nr:hypothetical protein [Cellulomonas flavigena]ADG75383.1 conserved hypothetical protein [Cellulomonas flavigena DSM 20109]
MNISTHVSGGRRTIVAMAVVAVLCLTLGLLLSRLIVSPGQAAANAAPPTAGPISVPVESRVIGNEVVLRGDVGYDDPVALTIETGDLGGAAVVTGQVKEVGATVDAASVVLEVVGRPVIALPGDLPTYRTLRAGVSGPDVQQLKAALRAVGLDGGDPAGATYDAAAAAGVRALYQKVGYEAPTGGDEVKDAVKAAQENLTSAQSEVRSAESAVAAAARAGNGSSVTELDGQVRVAEARLAYLDEQCAQPVDPENPASVDCTPPARVEAEAALASARAARAAADAAPDTTAEREAVRAARDRLTAARQALGEAQEAALTPLPATEVVYLPSLPRRVDAVSVQRGGVVQGKFMSVSGATVQITASASRADAELMQPGTAGSITVDGAEVPVTVAEVTVPDAAAAAGDGGGDGGDGDAKAPTGERRQVVFTVGELTAEQLASLQGSNVRVRVPVSSTDGAVLAVPLAALTAGPGGESRVELLQDGESRLVEVTTGLAAGGYVEIKASKAPLEEGDLVVVGVSADTDEGEDTAEDPDADADATKEEE